jgi:hypothetical protein
MVYYQKKKKESIDPLQIPAIPNLKNNPQI